MNSRESPGVCAANLWYFISSIASNKIVWIVSSNNPLLEIKYDPLNLYQYYLQPVLLRIIKVSENGHKNLIPAVQVSNLCSTLGAFIWSNALTSCQSSGRSWWDEQLRSNKYLQQLSPLFAFIVTISGGDVCTFGCNNTSQWIYNYFQPAIRWNHMELYVASPQGTYHHSIGFLQALLSKLGMGKFRERHTDSSSHAAG